MNKEEIRTFVGQRVRAVEDPDSGKTVYEFSLKDGVHTYRLPIGSGTKMLELISMLIEEALEKESEDRINSIAFLKTDEKRRLDDVLALSAADDLAEDVGAPDDGEA